MKILRIAASFLTAAILAAICIPVLAHGTLQVYLFDGQGSTAVGGESIGWSLDETRHLNTTSIKF